MTQTTAAAPVLGSVPGADRRLVGVDIARMLALVGMMVAHLVPDFTANGEWSAAFQLVNGRSAGLFAVLAGVSIALITRRARTADSRGRLAASVSLVTRAGLLALIGMMLAELAPSAWVILTYYAVLFVLAVPFLRLGAASLAVLAGGWMVVGPVLSHLVRPLLPEFSGSDPALASLADPWQLLSELTFTGAYPAVPWLTYLLAGMAIGRLDLRRPWWGGILMFGGVALAAVSVTVSRLLTSGQTVRQTLVEGEWDGSWSDLNWAELEEILWLGIPGTPPTDSWWWLTIWTPHTATPFDLAHTIGCAMAVLGACLLLGRVGGRVWAVVAGAGTMTLTMYALHMAMLSPIFFPPAGLSSLTLQVVVVLGIGAAAAMLRVRGPLETMTTAISRSAAKLVSSPPPPVPDARPVSPRAGGGSTG